LNTGAWSTWPALESQSTSDTITTDKQMRRAVRAGKFDEQVRAGEPKLVKLIEVLKEHFAELEKAFARTVG
jgi:ERCC4-related helicase